MKKLMLALIVSSTCYACVSVKSNGDYTVDSYGADWQKQPCDFSRAPSKAELGIGPEHQLTPDSLLDTKGASFW